MGRFENLEKAFYPGVGQFEFPEIYPVTELPDIDTWIQFNYAKSTTKNKSKTGVNFYILDQQFERIWINPDRYMKLLWQFAAVTGPDFSTYLDFPKSMRIYNTYRNRWLTRYWQECGLIVIPDVGWGLEDSFDWCFDGLPKHSIVSVSNVGAMESEENRANFKRGYIEMLNRLDPKEVLFYCHKTDNYEGPVHYIKFQMSKSNYA